MTKDTPELRLCTNILRLQSYKLRPDELILFDWMVVKAISFKYKPFHYSQTRIEAETRIKRNRQDAIIELFDGLGFLRSNLTVNPATGGRVKFFTVDFKTLADKNVLAAIMDETTDLFKYFLQTAKYHASQQSKPNKVAAKQTEDKQLANELFYMLNQVYDQRRKMYNDGKLTNKTPTKTKRETQLVRNAVLERKLLKLNSLYTNQSINHAFTSFCDALLIEEEAADRPLHYFLTYNEQYESWTVFERFLDRYNVSYSLSNR